MGIRSKKVSKLLPYLGVYRRKYRSEGDGVSRFHVLYCPITELIGMKSFDNLNKSDVILSSTEAKDLEMAACTVIELTFWMG